MGLDNGIQIKRNETSMKIYNKLKRFESSFDKEHDFDFEVCYWRKCWNVRHLIFDCLSSDEDENYEYKIERDDISKIISILKSLNENNWRDDGGSIWDWSDQKHHIKHHIKNLKYLHRLMGKYDLDVYFYDSY